MKNSIILIVGAVLGLAAGYFVFGGDTPLQSISTSTTTKFASAKVAEVGFIPADATATTSVVLVNTDSTDRIIESWYAACSGVGTSKTYLTGTGLASLTFTFGTTSSTANSNPATVANAAVLTISTSTPDAYTASSTNPFPTPVSRIWPSGSILLINANATNTASCVAGVHYLGS